MVAFSFAFNMVMIYNHFNGEGMDKLIGLTNEEVNKKKEEGKVNSSIKNPSKSYLEIITSNLFTYFNLIFFLIAIILILVKLYKALTFLPLIILNILIGIIQEIKSKRVLDKLTLMAEPKALVVRNGNEEKINVCDLVEGDLVIFSAGNQICADGRVVLGQALVNESLLTGESDEIKKEVDSILLSGSYIVSGKVYVKLTNVGSDSYINKLTLEAKENKTRETSEIIKSLNRLVKAIGIIIIPFALGLFCEAYFINGATIKNAVDSTVAAILMMIPEGLFLLASVSLAISAVRLAKNNVLTHDMKSIESLARINTLCIDKTGTITDNNMEVIDYLSIDCKISKEEIFQALVDFSYAQDFDNITMRAIKDKFKGDVRDKFISKSAFSSQFKYSAVNFESFSYVLGAPDFIIKENYLEYKDLIDSYQNEGYRVLALCRSVNMIDGKEITTRLTPMGLVVLDNPIRLNAVETFKYFSSYNVDIKVISGDNPKTVSMVASKALIKGAENYIDTSKLSDNELMESVEKYNVFGRVTPHQKQVIIRALKNKKNKVAMVGDGVNDILALKEADCSIALASGADAAMQVSQVVLLDSNFSHMPQVVLEGRRVVNNLETSGALFLSKNVYAIILTLIFLLCLRQFPVKTTQVGLVNMFTIGFPAFLLSQSPNKKLIRGNFIKNILKYAIPAGLTNAIMVTLMYFIGLAFNLSYDEISTASILIMASIGILILINVSRPFNKYKVVVVVLSIFGLILNVLLAFFTPFFNYYYDFKNLSAAGWIIFVILLIISYGMYLLIDFLISKYNGRIKLIDKIIGE